MVKEILSDRGQSYCKRWLFLFFFTSLMVGSLFSVSAAYGKENIFPTPIRSVTYYKFPLRWDEYDINKFKQDLDKMQKIGFNTVWFVIPIRDFMSVALPKDARQYNEKAWKNLEAFIKELKRRGMKAILPLGYWGVGWSPVGTDDPDRLGTALFDDEYYQVFEDYALLMTKRFKDYDNILFLLYTEGWGAGFKSARKSEVVQNSFRKYCEGVNKDINYWNKRWDTNFKGFKEVLTLLPREKNTQPRWTDYWRWVATTLAKRHGDLAWKIKRYNKIKGEIGYHDNNLINRDWAKGVSPIPEENPYDCLSFTAYPDKTFAVTDTSNLAEIKQQVKKQIGKMNSRYERFKKLYPHMPLMIGETGVPTLPFGETAQAEYLGSLLEFMASKIDGFNIWMWQDFLGASEKQRSFGLLSVSGEEKPAVDVLRRLLKENYWDLFEILKRQV